MEFSKCLAAYAASHNERGTDKTTSHSYGDLYDSLFAPLRAAGAKRVLEIGVYSGASVLALADYFVDATVYGVDITLANVRFGTGHPRIKYVCADATLPSTTDDVEGPFDLVLDDGSHVLRDQLSSLRAFAPHMSPDGIYVIEDVASASYRDDFERAADQCRPRMRLVGWYDLRYVKGQFDDIVAVFKVAPSDVV